MKRWDVVLEEKPKGRAKAKTVFIWSFVDDRDRAETMTIVRNAALRARGITDVVYKIRPTDLMAPPR